MTPPLRVIIRIEAEVDITDAAVWYERQESTLGHQFLNEVESTITKIAEDPTHYPRLRRKPDIRRSLTAKFPYRVFFVRRPDAIVVFRVLHGARQDREWKSKVPKE